MPAPGGGRSRWVLACAKGRLCRLHCFSNTRIIAQGFLGSRAPRIRGTLPHEFIKRPRRAAFEVGGTHGSARVTDTRALHGEQSRPSLL